MVLIILANRNFALIQIRASFSKYRAYLINFASYNTVKMIKVFIYLFIAYYLS